MYLLYIFNETDICNVQRPIGRKSPMRGRLTMPLWAIYPASGVIRPLWVCSFFANYYLLWWDV